MACSVWVGHALRGSHSPQSMHAAQVAAKYFMEREDGVFQFRPQYRSERAIADIQVRRSFFFGRVSGRKGWRYTSHSSQVA